MGKQALFAKIDKFPDQFPLKNRENAKKIKRFGPGGTKIKNLKNRGNSKKCKFRRWRGPGERRAAWGP